LLPFSIGLVYIFIAILTPKSFLLGCIYYNLEALFFFVEPRYSIEMNKKWIQKSPLKANINKNYYGDSSSIYKTKLTYQ